MTTAQGAGALMTSEQRIATRALEILGSLNSALLREILTDDVVLELPFAPKELGGRRVEGIEQVVTLMSRAKTVYRWLRFDISERYPIPSANTVILRATSVGEFLNGISYRNEYVQLFAFREDRVCHWIEFFDATQARDAFATLG